jgi:hypothetical protein
VRGGVVGGITPDDRARLARGLEDARLRTDEMRRLAEERHRQAVEEMRERRKRLDDNADGGDAQDK